VFIGLNHRRNLFLRFVLSICPMLVRGATCVEYSDLVAGLFGRGQEK
jgi:hypothetical protein